MNSRDDDHSSRNLYWSRRLIPLQVQGPPSSVYRLHEGDLIIFFQDGLQCIHCKDKLDQKCRLKSRSVKGCVESANWPEVCFFEATLHFKLHTSLVSYCLCVMVLYLQKLARLILGIKPQILSLRHPTPLLQLQGGYNSSSIKWLFC